MFDHTFLEKFEARGEWWLPDRSERRCAGTLRFDDRGIRLDLVGSLMDEPLSRAAFVQGTSVEGRRITLCDCQSAGAVENGGVKSSWMWADRLIIGDHISTESQLASRCILVSYTHLESWFMHAPFKHEYGEDEGLHVWHKAPPIVTASIPDLGVTVSLAYSYGTSGGFGPRLELHHQDALRVEFGEPQPFPILRKTIGDLQALLGILIGHAILPNAVRIFPDQQGADCEPREVLWPVFWDAVQPELHWFRMFLPYRNLGLPFPTLIENWLRKVDLFRPVYDLLLSTYYDPTGFSHSRFLSLVQALEGYHRRVYQGLYTTDSEFERYRRIMVRSLPDDMDDTLRSILGNRLKLLNEVSLSRRLEELLDSLPEEIVCKAIRSDTTSFARRVAETRNHLSHQLPDVPGAQGVSIYEERELLGVSRALQLVLTLLILRSLGVPDSALNEAVDRTRDTFGLRRIN